MSQSSYEDKKKMLFDSLSTAEACIKGTSLEQTDRPPPSLSRKSSTKSVSKFQGKESIFKRPAVPIRKCLPPRRMPDFQVSSDTLDVLCRLMSAVADDRFNECA